MANVTVVGAQWGDEGKGKIVDWLSHRADVVVRFQGGHNAGHTLVVDGRTYKLSLLPSGVVRGKLSIIGDGVVINPWALCDEIATVRDQGLHITPDVLRVAEGASLILPYHWELDRFREDDASGRAIGTTRRGIGPAYEDRVGRRAVRVCDLYDRPGLHRRIETALDYHNTLRQGLGRPLLDGSELLDSLTDVAGKLRPFVTNTAALLDEARGNRRTVLFEGAQGIMLDVHHGTYPYVTSSNTVPGQAAGGAGTGPASVGYVLGITKAYTTRVGEGPFPTEQANDVGRTLGQRGREFGTVTGRQRRCGWFDSVMVRQAVRVAGIEGIALTKLDVLDGFETLRVCVRYRAGNETFDYFPPGETARASIEPEYEELEGWTDSTRGARSWADLPATAVKYIRRIEELIGVPVTLLSTSPEREDTILVRDPFAE